jgi:hypothetical protein
LLQAKNTATYTDLKNAIANTATKDVFTGATSNNTWGSGKIDVYRAAASLLFCQALSRTTYSYDSSTGGASNSTLNLGSNKAATRFTPTSSGKLGGVYFKQVQAFLLQVLRLKLDPTVPVYRVLY